MARSSALAVVGNGIVGILADACPRDVFPNTHFQLYFAADLMAPRNPVDEAVSVFLYRVSFNTTRRNLPPRVTAEGQRLKPPVPLDLHFMVTPWTRDPTQQLRLLGWIARTLEDTPILPAGVLNRFAGSEPEVFRSDESVEFVPEPMTQQELVAIWEVAKTRQQPSLTYVARMVMIESTVSSAVAPLVQTRDLNAGTLTLP